MRALPTILTATFLASATAWAGPILSLLPGGAVSGTPGSTVGWGYTLDNPNNNFAVITSSQFCLGTTGVTPPQPACVASGIGVYTDFSFNFVVAGPAPESPAVTQAFSATLSTGAGSFAIGSGASGGAVESGQIVFTYDLFSTDPNDPNFNPGTGTISVGNFLAAPASVTVAAASPVPEPAGLVWSGWALVALGMWRRRRR